MALKITGFLFTFLKNIFILHFSQSVTVEKRKSSQDCKQPYEKLRTSSLLTLELRGSEAARWC